jgi:hypothetical protein
MQPVSRAQPPAPNVFAIPEHAHVELIQMRDHLRLLAFLSASGSTASRHDATLQPDALAWWFSRLSRDIDEIVEATYWPADAANA